MIIARSICSSPDDVADRLGEQPLGGRRPSLSSSSVQRRSTRSGTSATGSRACAHVQGSVLDANRAVMGSTSSTSPEATAMIRSYASSFDRVRRTPLRP